MKEIFDRHQEKLTAAERHAIWRTVSGSPATKSRSRLRWGLSTSAATLATAVIAFAIFYRPPAVSPPLDSIPEGNLAPNQPALPATPQVEPGPDHDLSMEQEALPGRIDAPRPQEIPDVSPIRGDESRKLTAQSRGGDVQRQGAGTIRGRTTENGGKRPLPFTNILLPSLKRGALSGADGAFVIPGVPAGTYEIRAMYIGREPVAATVVVPPGGTVDLNLDLGGQVVAKNLEELVITADKLLDTKSSTTRQEVSGETLQDLPVATVEERVALKAGVVATGGELHFRGGRGGEVKFQVDNTLEPSAPSAATGATPASRPKQPPVVPTTGGNKLPNDEAYDSMFFRNYGVNPFIATDEDALSTFAVDVDAASYTVTRRYLELGNLPPRDAVRAEEFVNYFPQGYPKFENDDFRILIDGAPSPFGGADYHLLRIGIKGREIDEWDRKPAYLTFVIDVSGSMARENRLGLVKQSLTLLVDQLRDDDRIGIVVYGDRGQVLLEPTSLGETLAYADGYRRRSDDTREDEPEDRRAGRRQILDAINRLGPAGSTNAEEGLLLGYDMARRVYRSGAINRVVLCSDGVANVGRTGPESILARVRSEADRGIHLSAIGFGMGNYNDVLMEQLANKGDGNYYYVDELGEARRVFVENLTGTLQTIAKDAKIQVEFDPARVQRYRLIGFENRDVADRDFRNDKVDAGEIGAGHEVTALYEVKLDPRGGSGTIATARLRYARPEHDRRGPAVREIARTFRASDLERRFRDASPHFRLDAAVAEFAEILRGSYWAKESRMSDVLPLARDAARDLRSDAADEFVSLVERAAQIHGVDERDERE